MPARRREPPLTAPVERRTVATAALAAMVTALPLRLRPGDDLRRALEAAFVTSRSRAAFVVQGIGSLSGASLRYAGRSESAWLAGDREIIALAGSLSAQGAHLHLSVADADGRVRGGHVGFGCTVRTTAEVLIVDLPLHRFSRVADPRTGWLELEIEPAPSSDGPR